MTTHADILSHRHSGSWLELERIAQEISRYAQQHGGTFFAPVLGGGTRLMLAIEHRISDDIDLFVDSPGWLPYVSPRINEGYEDQLKSYNEDGDHVKWVFPIGEIDFIVRTPLLNQQGLWNPPAKETSFTLEPPLEVLAKKLFYRGWALTPRDLFDWYSIEQNVPIAESTRPELAQLLVTKLDEINHALMYLPQKIHAVRAWDAIKAPIIPDFHEVAQWAKEQISFYRMIIEERHR